jgi:thiamine-phosphate pyrophosphorylase
MKPRVVVIVQPDDRTTLPALAGLDDASYLVHLRFAPEGEAWQAALRARERMPGVPFVVSAEGPHGLDGVHLGGPLRGKLGSIDAPWISVPAHTDEDVAEAAHRGASAVYVSPIFATPGKGPARGTDAIERARALAGPTLVYALGGVDASNAEACVAAGADGVAVIRAIAGAPSPVDALRAIDQAVRRGRASRGAS